MVKRLCGLTVLMGLLASAAASADEKPAFDLQAPSVLVSGQEHPVLLMNNTGRELKLKLTATPLQSQDLKQTTTYPIVLRTSDKTDLNLAEPVSLAPGEVKQLTVTLRDPLAGPGSYQGYLAAYEAEGAGRSFVVRKPLTATVVPTEETPLTLRALVGSSLTFEEYCPIRAQIRGTCDLDWTLTVRFPPGSETHKLNLPTGGVRLMGPNGHSVLLHLESATPAGDKKVASNPVQVASMKKPPAKTSPAPSEATLKLSFKDVNRAGTYTATIGGDEKTQVSITLKVADHWALLLTTLVLGATLYYLLRGLTSYGKLKGFQSRCLKLLGEYQSEQTLFEKALSEAKAPARAFNIEESVAKASLALKEEARTAAGGIVMFDDESGVHVERYRVLKTQVQGWSDFGHSLATLASQMEEANAKSPPDFIQSYSRTRPLLFQEAAALFEQPKPALTIGNYQAHKALVDAMVSRLEDWTERNDQVQQLHTELESWTERLPPGKFLDTAAAAKEKVERAWLELWERTDYTVPLDDIGSTVTQLLNSAQNTLIELTKNPPPTKTVAEPLEAMRSFSAETGPERRFNHLTLKKEARARPPMLTLEEEKRRNAVLSVTTNLVLGLSTAALMLVVYLHDMYDSTWGDSWKDYWVALGAGYGSQALPDLLSTVFQRAPATKLMETIKLPAK